MANLRKVFTNYLSTDIKLSKTQLSKMIQSGGFLGRLLGPLIKTVLPLIKSVIKPLAKSVLIPFGLTAAALAADAGRHKNILGSWHNHPSNNNNNNNNNNNSNNNKTVLIIPNNELEEIIKIGKSLEDSGLLLKGVT